MSGHGRFYRILLVGAPGVGKGSYGHRLADVLKCALVSSGTLLRREIADHTELGLKAGELVNQGKFVPDDLMLPLMSKALHACADNSARDRCCGYILDGFPRNVQQAQLCWSSDTVRVDHVIHLTQPRHVIAAKLSSRRTCASCGFVYNFAAIDTDGYCMTPLIPRVEGICDKCGSTEPLMKRDDDDVDIVRKRLDQYEIIATPLLRFYRDKNILQDFHVRGGVEQCFPDLCQLVERFYA